METVVINNSAPQQSQSETDKPLNRIISIILWLLVIGTLIVVAVIAYVVIDNWSYIVAFFTTGFIGWLNPFDNPADDTGPIDTVLGESGGGIVYTIVGALPVIGPALQSGLR